MWAGPAQQGTLCPPQAALGRDTDRKERAPLLALVTSLCWRAVRDQQAHQTPTTHWEKLPNPRLQVCFSFYSSALVP